MSGCAPTTIARGAAPDPSIGEATVGIRPRRRLLRRPTIMGAISMVMVMEEVAGDTVDPRAAAAVD